MKIETRLEAVTVYAQGAVCERRALVPAGAPTRLALTGLPMSMLPGSLRARTASADGPTVLAGRPGFEVALLEPIDASAEQRSLEAAEAELQKARQAAARVQQEIDDLRALQPRYREPRRGEPPRDAPLEATLQLAGFVADALPGLQAEHRALDAKAADASNEVQLRKRRLAEASSEKSRGPVRVERTAELELSASPDKPLALIVEYQVPAARWLPMYELRMGRALAGGLLRMRAAVAQHTGEDWTGVRLALSTAQLDRSIERPELRSIRIGRRQQPPPRSGWREPPAGLEHLFADYDALASLRAVGAVTRAGTLKKGRRPAAPVMAPEPPPAATPPAMYEMQAMARSESGEIDLDAEDGAAPAPPPPPAPMRSSAPLMAKRAMAPRAPTATSMASGGMPRGGGRARMADGFSREAAADEPMAELESSPGGEDSFGEAAEPALTVEAGLLDYDLMRMMGPAEAHRGRLQPGSAIELQAVAVSVQVQVLTALITLHGQTAATVASLAGPQHTRPPRESAGSFDYRYLCESPTDVPSAPGWKVIPVASADVELAAEYQCAPSIEARVYRTVQLKNRSGHALLAGPVDVFVGDGFLLTAGLPTLAPGGDAQTLGLGVEEAIKVARNTHFKETTGGLLGGTTVLPHEVSVELDNRTAGPATIEVRERVPVTDDDEVKVEEARVEPAWKKDEAPRDGVVVRGARAWKVTLAPGEKKTLTAEYSIRIPSSRVLQGGNRRI